MNRIPWTTIALIAVGVAAQKALAGSRETGTLAIDAVFLWFLGAAAEGLLGWHRLLLFVLVVAGGQTIVLFGWQGPGGVIMGLAAALCVWNPRRAWAVGLAALAYVALSRMSVAANLVGAGLGVAAAMVLLARGWVDTRGEDLFARRRRAREESILREAKRVERKLDPLAKEEWGELPPQRIDVLEFVYLTVSVFAMAFGVVLLFGCCGSMIRDEPAGGVLLGTLLACLLIAVALVFHRLWLGR